MKNTLKVVFVAAMGALAISTAGCSASSDTPEGVDSPAASVSSSADSPEPVYYAFKFDEASGCGPQGRFVKVIGSDLYYVAADGCDLFADRGTIYGDEVRLVGRSFVCMGDGATDYSPSTLEITGGADDLQIAGETRVVGPAGSLEDLDRWWSEENERVEYPTHPVSVRSHGRCEPQPTRSGQVAAAEHAADW
ncbi:MAG: hypothetical protein WCF36_18280 [Candidatus Nanopelagicales bacterium]